MGEPSRLRILGLLATRDRSVEELASRLGLRPPTVSHHLARLRAVDLVAMRAEGTTHMYSLNPATLREQNRALTPRTIAGLVEDAGGDEWERKVLRDFVAGGRLTRIPAQLKKRLVILRWLVTEFETGRRYPEREVNAILGARFDDHASLRRHLVDQGLLERASSVYRRT